MPAFSHASMLFKAVVVAGSASSLLAQPIDFVQITQTPFGVGMFEPSVSEDGNKVAFRTAADLTGANPDGSFEVFVYDRVTGLTDQLTSTPGGSGTSIQYPMIVPDGSRVIFLSPWDFFQNTPGSTFQLWEVDASTGAYRQVTQNPPSTPVFDPRLSGDGRFATFLARIDPAGTNPGGSLEVFRIEIATGDLTQISENAVSAAQFPDINGDGSRIVWGDRANYDGSNTNGGLEIWLWDETDGVSHVTDQASGLETNLPKIDAAGRYVAFMSLFDFSGSGASGRKLHVADTSTGQIRLITAPGVGGSGANYPDAEIAPDGSKVYFESNVNLGGLNPDGNRELFAYVIAENRLEAVTQTTGGATIVQLSDDATRRYLDVSASNQIAYRTDRDLDPGVSNEPNANLDLFLTAIPASCPADLAPPAGLDFQDILAFIAAYNNADASADLAAPTGTLNFFDVLEYLNAFAAGCP